MENGFKYDPRGHVYTTLDGHVCLHNTGVLQTAGLVDYSMVKEEFMEPARKLGTAVHKATELLDKERAWRAKYEQYEARVNAWKGFKRYFKFQPLLIEKPLMDMENKIGTQVDRWGASMQGEVTVQIKTCKIQDHVALQLAFEEWCVNLYRFAERIKKDGLAPFINSSDRRFAVELRSDGLFKIQRFDDPNDLRVFFAAVRYVEDPNDRQALQTIMRWKKTHR